MICGKCETNLLDDAKFCRKCGTIVEAVPIKMELTKKCPLCGAENLESAKFCRVDRFRFQEPDAKLDIFCADEIKRLDSKTRCPRCDAIYPPSKKFCKIDGSSLQIISLPEIAENQVTTHSSMMNKCPKCGVDNPLGAKFCKVDGYKLQQDEYITIAPALETESTSDKVLCSKCGATFDVGVRFCNKDGTPLQSEGLVKEAAVTSEIETEIKPTTTIPSTSESKSADQKEVTAEAEVLSSSQLLEKRTIAPTLKTESTSNKVLCSKCGAAYDLGAKFCNKDGTPLQSEGPAKEASITAEITTEIKPTTTITSPSESKSADQKKVTVEPEFLSSPQPLEAPALEADSTSGKVLCSKCGAAYDLGAKFCIKDGTPLQSEGLVKEASVTSEIKTEIKTTTTITSPSESKSADQKEVTAEHGGQLSGKKKVKHPYAENTVGRKAKIFATLFITLLIIAGAGSYLYFSGNRVGNPDVVKAPVDNVLKAGKVGNDAVKKIRIVEGKKDLEGINQLLNKGKQFHEDGKFPEARKMYRKILQIDRNNKTAISGINDANMAEKALLAR